MLGKKLNFVVMMSMKPSAEIVRLVAGPWSEVQASIWGLYGLGVDMNSI